jgi:shikimate dehydrogenase
MNRFGVLGFPVSHSLSPTIHATFYQRHNLEAEYRHLEVRPEDLDTFRSELAQGTYAGLNITYPYKDALLNNIYQLEANAAELGAINTLVRLPPDPGATRPLPYRGHNTDGEGLCLYLERDLAIDLSRSRILILGAGNAAKAALLSLIARTPKSITLLTRDAARYQTPFFAHLTSHPIFMETGDGAKEAAESDLILQATPFGLGGHTTETMPWNLDKVPKNATVVDLNYKKGNQATPFLSSLRRNIRAVDGKGMLVYQAAEAFRLWWGFLPDVSGIIASL